MSNGFKLGPAQWRLQGRHPIKINTDTGPIASGSHVLHPTNNMRSKRNSKACAAWRFKGGDHRWRRHHRQFSDLSDP